ncbi:MAG: ABC transporter ATP-binding protein [Bifidobacteriaceae bacterium]|jgi:putative ABC transport system ATP-binding protein|nr:ABC transporter ATP-binding protein [Bifidobacteriaceae bacterium]
MPEPTSPKTVASAADLVRIYGTGHTAVRALDHIEVAFAGGQLTAIMGPSGSGNSTLLHCLAGLDRPTSGTVTLGGRIISGLPERALTRLRRDQLGFVFQSFNLVPTLTALENVTLPLDLARRPVERDWLDGIVQTLGLKDRLDHRPAELSGGQQQRVACARALIARPRVVFADEPTGNLDSTSARGVLGFLRRSVDELGQSVIMVTHDPAAAAHAHRVLFLSDGRLVGELAAPTQDRVLDRLRMLGHQEEQAADTVATLGRAALAPTSRAAV